MMRSCHVEVADQYGHVEPCGDPALGQQNYFDDYGQLSTMPICINHMEDQ